MIFIFCGFATIFHFSPPDTIRVYNPYPVTLISYLGCALFTWYSVLALSYYNVPWIVAYHTLSLRFSGTAP